MKTEENDNENETNQAEEANDDSNDIIVNRGQVYTMKIQWKIEESDDIDEE